MSESMLGWADSLPSRWRSLPLKRVASIATSNVDKKTYDDGVPVRLCNYTDVYYHEQITPELPFMEATATPAEIRRFGLRAGDVIITKDSESWSDIAIPACVRAEIPNLVCGYHLTILRGETGKLDGRYLLRVLQASGVREQLWTSANGITRFGIGLGAIGRTVIPVPPLDVQRAIADFLDRKTAALDALIDKKERLLALLQEKRQALITQAVTKGLDPNVPMKDSGIEWLGEIPAHWHVGRLGYYARVRNGSTPSRTRADYWTDGTIPWLSSGKVNEWLVSEPSEFITSHAVRETSLTIVPAGAVLVGMIGQGRTRGTTARLAIDACINQNMAAAVPGPALDGGFLHYFLAHAYEPLREFGRGGQQDALNCQILASFPIVIPPRTEQAAISSHIESAIEHEQRIRVSLERQIATLREYRQALITVAVTGQFDVTSEQA